MAHTFVAASIKSDAHPPESRFPGARVFVGEQQVYVGGRDFHYDLIATAEAPSQAALKSQLSATLSGPSIDRSLLCVIGLREQALNEAASLHAWALKPLLHQAQARVLEGKCALELIYTAEDTMGVSYTLHHARIAGNSEGDARLYHLAPGEPAEHLGGPFDGPHGAMDPLGKLVRQAASLGQEAIRNAPADHVHFALTLRVLARTDGHPGSLTPRSVSTISTHSSHRSAGTDGQTDGGSLWTRQSVSSCWAVQRAFTTLVLCHDHAVAPQNPPMILMQSHLNSSDADPRRLDSVPQAAKGLICWMLRHSRRAPQGSAGDQVPFDKAKGPYEPFSKSKYAQLLQRALEGSLPTMLVACLPADLATKDAHFLAASGDLFRSLAHLLAPGPSGSRNGQNNSSYGSYHPQDMRSPNRSTYSDSSLARSLSESALAQHGRPSRHRDGTKSNNSTRSRAHSSLSDPMSTGPLAGTPPRPPGAPASARTSALLSPNGMSSRASDGANGSGWGKRTVRTGSERSSQLGLAAGSSRASGSQVHSVVGDLPSEQLSNRDAAHRRRVERAVAVAYKTGRLPEASPGCHCCREMRDMLSHTMQLLHKQQAREGIRKNKLNTQLQELRNYISQKGSEIPPPQRQQLQQAMASVSNHMAAQIRGAPGDHKAPLRARSEAQGPVVARPKGGLERMPSAGHLYQESQMLQEDLHRQMASMQHHSAQAHRSVQSLSNEVHNVSAQAEKVDVSSLMSNMAEYKDLCQLSSNGSCCSSDPDDDACTQPRPSRKSIKARKTEQEAQ